MKKAKVGHPDHGIHKKRLNRVRGQIDGIEKMIDERRYCPEIVIQIRAAASALKAIEAQIVETHIQGCINKAIQAKSKEDILEKVEEIMDLLRK